MLASATGADLDNLAALYGVERLVIAPADPSTTPPAPAVLEGDGRLRRRAQLAPDGFSVAGPSAAYIFHALSADANVLDVAFDSPSAAVANVYVISGEEGRDGDPTQALLDAVTAALSADTVRPAGDRLSVAAATFVDYQIELTLTIEGGPDPAVVRAAALASLQAFARDNFRIGRDIPLSGIYAAATVPSVLAVDLTAPAANVATTATQAPRATMLTVK